MDKMYKGHKVYMNGKYPAIFLNGENAHIHRLVWIEYNEDIPTGCIIHHKNEDKQDWNIDNLELLNRSNHIKEHKDIVKRKGMPLIGYYNGVKYNFPNVRQASIYTDVREVAIYRIFKGTQYQSKGWTFERGGLS